MRSSADAARARLPLLLLGAVGATSLALRLALLDQRWINPDEGAHLMDGVLTLQGLVPNVDFDSRQPLYTLANAALLGAFGESYQVGRWLPLACSFLTGAVLFLLGRRLFDARVGLLSAVLFWALPFELLQSMVVKTEPLTMLLSAGALTAVVHAGPRGHRGWLLLGGALAASAFYVRESSLALLPAVLGFLLIRHEALGRALSSFACFAVGSLLVYAGVLAFYAQYVSGAALLGGSITPLGISLAAVETLWDSLGSGPAPAGGLRPAEAYAPWERPLYLHYVIDAVKLHGFLLAGLAFAAGGWLVRARRDGLRGPDVVAFALPLLWIAFLALAYLYYYWARGFYIDYFRELLPPLVLAFSAWLVHRFPALRAPGRLEASLAAALVAGAVLFGLQSLDPSAFGVGHHGSLALLAFSALAAARARDLSGRALLIALCALLAVAVVLSRQPPLREHLAGLASTLAVVAVVFAVAALVLLPRSRGIARLWAFAESAVLAGTAVVGVTYAGVLLDLRYDSVWSPESVASASRYIREHTEPADRVLSGGVIWELEAGRRPFLDSSHPLSYEFSMSPGAQQRFRSALQEDPPAIIVRDGYLEKTYLDKLPELEKLLDSSAYERVASAEPARHPVLVYQRTASGAGE